MTRLLSFTALVLVCGTVSAQEPVYDPLADALTSIDAGNYKLAKDHISEIENEAGKLYAQAKLTQVQGSAKEAIQIVAQALALYSIDQETLGNCEMYIIELYMELGLLEQADNAARQVTVMYAGTDFEKEANALRSKIETMKKASEKASE